MFQSIYFISVNKPYCDTFLQQLLPNAPVTRPYICQRTPTYGDTSDRLGARFI